MSRKRLAVGGPCIEELHLRHWETAKKAIAMEKRKVKPNVRV